MIATLRGEVTHIEENAVTVEVGGVGLRVFVPAPLRSRLRVGETALIYTHLVVREDALTLYGFETQADRELFQMLLGVSGGGPKVSLAVLSTLTVEPAQRAVMNEESEILGRVPGVGQRTAQNIVLHLHGKIRPSDALEQ